MQCPAVKVPHATACTITQHSHWTALVDDSGGHPTGAFVNKQQSILACDSGLFY